MIRWAGKRDGSDEAVTLYQIVEHTGQRYIGEADRGVVHDTWHTDCEECLVEDMIDRGVAVAFAPDELDQALWEGFEYCEHCFDRTEPLPPHPPSAECAGACG